MNAVEELMYHLEWKLKNVKQINIIVYAELTDI